MSLYFSVKGIYDCPLHSQTGLWPPKGPAWNRFRRDLSLWSQSSDTSERGVVPLERCFQTGTLKDRGCLQALPEHKPLLVRRYKVMPGYIPYGTKPIIQWDWERKQCVDFCSGTSTSLHCGSTKSLKFEHPEDSIFLPGDALDSNPTVKSITTHTAF